MKNFYNDDKFRVNAFAHLLPQVFKLCNAVLLTFNGSLADANKNVDEMHNSCSVVNEVLELYRLVLEKYAAMQLTYPILSELTVFLHSFWNIIEQAIRKEASEK